MTILEIGDDLLNIDYLVLSHRFHLTRNSSKLNPKQLLWVELYARLMKPVDVWSKVPDEVKEFLAEIRESSKAYKQDEDEASTISRSQVIYGEIENLLKSEFPGLLFLKDQKCGPFILDFFIPEKNLVLEICPEYQFYVRTQNLTSSARWRHSLIRAMGFKLVFITETEWSALESSVSEMSKLLNDRIN